ncbi:MAG: YfhO family protein [Clostridiales bacterium]|nr:YfhO family protein [Clostridiales bacterium]
MDNEKNVAPLTAKSEETGKKKRKFKIDYNLIKSAAYENRFMFLAALCTALIMLVVYYCYNLFPFGEVTILRMDLYHQYGPLYAEFYDRLTSGASFLYSWTTGGGSGFLGNFSNYISSPFSLLILFFGHKNMPEAIAAIILLKSAAASFTCSYFLKNSQKHNTPATAAFGVLYACSGFFIAYYWNIMWLDAFYLLPLIALGIEQLIGKRKSLLYYIALILAALTNYYMAYMLAIFSVLYFLSFYFGHYSLADTYFGKLAKNKDKKPLKRISGNFVRIIRNSRFLDSGIRFAFTALGAVLSCAFLLIPLYYILSVCSATSDSWPQNWKEYFTVFDFLANHLAHLDPTIRSSGEDVLPNIYAGILPLMLVPLYLFSKKISIREKAADVALLGVFFASFYINKVNFVWHGFHFPNDLPYRFSNMYSLLLIAIAFKAYRNIKEFTSRQILGSGLAIVIFAILVQEIGSKNFSELSLWITIAFVGIYVASLYLIKDKRYPAFAAATLLLCAVSAEYTIANTNHYSMDQTKSSYAGDYNDFTVLKDVLDTRENNRFYRMELSKIRARMDPAWYNYNGVSTFSSMAYEKVSNLHYYLGLYSNYINSHTYNPQTPIYNSMFSLKYIVDNADKLNNDTLYTEVASSGVFKAYRNNFYLPIAYRVNADIAFWQHEGTNPFAIQNDYIKNAAGVDEVLVNIPSFGTEYNNIDLFTNEEFATGIFYYNKTEGVEEGTVTMNYITTKSQNLYLFLKSSTSSVKSIELSSDYGYFTTQSVDTKPYVFDLGMREAGEIISVKVPITGASTGILYIHMAGLDMDAFREAYSTLQSDAINITSFSDTRIKGDINVSEDGVLYTSINYDRSWTVFIDGKKINPDTYIKVGDALLSVPITEGYHTVEFKFFPYGMPIGIAITVITLAIVFVLYLLHKLHAFKFDPKTAKQERKEQLALEEALPPITLYSGDINTEDEIFYFDSEKYNNSLEDGAQEEDENPET